MLLGIAVMCMKNLKTMLKNNEMNNLKPNDWVRILFPQSETEKRLHQRRQEQFYRVLEIYSQDKEKNQYARCEEIGEDGTSYGVWHFHAEALVKHKKGGQDDEGQRGAS